MGKIGYFVLACCILFGPRVQAQSRQVCTSGRQCNFSSALSGNGSAAAPSYSFANDTDTGWYRSAANELSCSTNGTQRWKIDSSGHLFPGASQTYNIGSSSNYPNQITGGSVGVQLGANGFGLNGQTVLSAASNSASDQVRLTSQCAAVTATSSTPALRLSCSNALDANDLCLGVQTSAGVNILSGDQEGDLIGGGTMTLALGSNLASTTVGGAISTSSTPIGNLGAGEDDLHSYTLPANSLTVTGRTIKVKAIGTIANDVNAKTLQLYFGASIISIAIPISTACNWFADAYITRTGSNAQRYAVEVRVVNSATNAVSGIFMTQGTLTQTETGTIAIKATATATTDNDIVQNLMYVEFK